MSQTQEVQAAPVAQAQPQAIAPAQAAQPAVAPAQATLPEQAVAAGSPPASSSALARPKVKRARRDAPANGRISSQVSSIPTMRAIWNEYYKKGLSYEKIEQNPKYDLRHAKGMTAYRLCRKYEKLSGTKRPKGKK
jgi:hypothetical protein